MTNREIAQRLGISPAALSLVINHKPGVSDRTRTRVLADLEEMGYGDLVKQVVTPTSRKNLCFIIYKRHGEILDLHPFFLLLMEHIENQARCYGYNILLCNIDKRRPVEPQIQRINQLDSQGAILFATEMLDEDLQAFREIRIPIVSLDNDFAWLPCNSISINNQMGTFQAIEYLIKNGYRRIGYLKSYTRISSFDERYHGYQDALAHFGLSFFPEDIWSVQYTEEGSYRDICLRLDSSPDLPEAFVSDDDTMSVGAMRAFSARGYKIPEDVAFVGFNDRPTCVMTSPPLSTINVSKGMLAEEAVHELMRMIKNEKNATPDSRSRKIRIGTNLVIRESVAKKYPTAEISV